MWDKQAISLVGEAGVGPRRMPDRVEALAVGDVTRRARRPVYEGSSALGLVGLT